MNKSPEPSPYCEDIDAALRYWQQGDCLLGEMWFAWRFVPPRPISEQAVNSFTEYPDIDIVEEQVPGLAIVTQTCDIVRTCKTRPFLEVCPLVYIDMPDLSAVQHGKQPRFAYLSGLRDKGLVVDLDRVMVVEKPLVMQHERVRGCFTDEDVRNFAEALARKRSRFAFPDDFVGWVSPLSSRLSSKHNKDSPEGIALRALREIRVHATPSWSADQVEIFFHFIRNVGGDLSGFQVSELNLETWLHLLQPSGRFMSVDGHLVDLEDITASEYVHSDRLDHDNLTIAYQLRG